MQKDFDFVIVQTRLIINEVFDFESVEESCVYACPGPFIVLAAPSSNSGPLVEIEKEKCRVFLDRSKLLVEENKYYNPIQWINQFFRITPFHARLGGSYDFYALAWWKPNVMLSMHFIDTRYYDCIARSIGYYTLTVPDKISGQLAKYLDDGIEPADFHKKVLPLMVKGNRSVISCVTEFNVAGNLLFFKTNVPSADKSQIIHRPTFDQWVGNPEFYKKYISEKYLVEWIYHDIEDQINETGDFVQLGAMAKFALDQKLFPGKQRMEEIFEKAVKLLNSLPQGERWQQLNLACYDLKAIFYYLCKH